MHNASNNVAKGRPLLYRNNNHATIHNSFFENRMSKSKKVQQPARNNPSRNDSRSLSARSDIMKKSARQTQHKVPALTKKERQIREAIQYRFKKSKMRGYVFEQNLMTTKYGLHEKSKPKGRKFSQDSQQMEEYSHLKDLKYVNLKQFHEKESQAKNLVEEKKKNSFRNKLKIRTDSSIIIKTDASEKSYQKINNLLKPYLPRTPTIKQHHSSGKHQPIFKQDWKFISIQEKGGQKRTNSSNHFAHSKSRSKNKEIKALNSHRVLTEEPKPDVSHGMWGMVPKLKDLSKLNKKYRF